MNFLKQYYGPAEGPLGFPMPDRTAQAVASILQGLPKTGEFAYRKMINDKGPSELLSGERSDVSWITCQDPDRANEVVVARGMNDNHFKLNPIVTLQHAYHVPPVGRSLWRKVVRDGQRHGVKAKTHYPPRPDDWPGETWPADVAFSLVQAGLLRGKSIGFLPTRVHPPTADERKQPGWERVELVIDEWILLEYACCFLPCQQNAVVETVSKSIPIEQLRALGIAGTALSAIPVPFTTLPDLETALVRAVQRIDPAAMFQEELDRIRGRI